MKTAPFLTLVLCASASLATAQNFQTFSSESFQYPTGTLDQNNGGTGWAAQWFSGGSADVTTPGLDAIGEKCTTIQSDSGCFRTLDVANWPDPNQAFNGQIGTDGTTLYVRFLCQRVAGGDDHYGGLSLVEQFGPEKKFLGSPWMTYAWGFQDNSGGRGPWTVAGSSVDNVTSLVYRIDFMPGDERMRLWLNPQTRYPDSGADIDEMVGDFLFNEIRLQSGNGGQGGLQTGYHFDGIEIEIRSGELRGDVDTLSASAGGTYTMTHHVDPGLYANSNYLVAGSFSGTAGIPLAPNVTVPLTLDLLTLISIETVNAGLYGGNFGLVDANGNATTTFTLPPTNDPSAIGLTIYHASVLIDPSVVPVHATNWVSFQIAN